MTKLQKTATQTTTDSMPPIKSFLRSRLFVQLYADDEQQEYIGSIKTQEFEDGLKHDTDELEWPVVVNTEYGPVCVDTETIPMWRFWEYSGTFMQRQLDRLEEFYSLTLNAC